MAAEERRVGNLPRPRTGTVDRGAELAEIERLFEGSSREGPARLVTLTGVGGVGKTRVALNAATALQSRFRDGAWLVELSPLRQGDLLAHAIAEALPLADQTTRPMIDVLAEYLAERELLLVLDTCEHLTDACAFAAEALLRAAPGLRVLATSRRTLNVVGERILSIEPLPVPEADDARAGTADAVALLTMRATEAVPGFTVTDADRAELVRLCRRLDGLPLAIELAAARLRDLPVRELTARLDDRFAVLGDTDGIARDAEPPWHQALRTAIGWSHQLCTPAERLLWARLSVFAGSFDAETARQVCADDHLPAQQIPAVLGTLTEKSILIWQPTGGGERYRMLDTIREYGAHWLRGLGEEDTLRRRHRDHYLALARWGDAAWIGPDQFAWYDRMTAEHDNLRAALEYSLTEPEGHIALEMTVALWFFWYSCGFLREGRHYLDQALAADTTPSPARVKALYVCGQVVLHLGDLPALEARAAECTALAAHFGDAERRYAAATELRALALRGDLAQTVSQAEVLLATDWREKPLTLLPLAALVLLTHSLVASSRFEEAVAWLDELSAACDRNGERSMRAWGDFVRAQAELALGRFQEADAHARAALLVKHRLRDGVGTGMALEALARAATATGRGQDAAWLLGLAAQLWETLGRPQAGVPAVVAAHQVCERQTREALGADAYQRAFDAGCTIDLNTGIAHTLNPAAVPPLLQ
ncbi:ATP-binding protein [Streptomyces ochraceiscleroticus]|uniref:ATP-binding protein n=1 Tax=Streptomyces ochraceiscleroticus TaxID=47761 RepID=A0ABW1MIM3_9ACTN|nr:AAA family ATPase [Streptomyces ochraceiscleroticus]